MKQTILGIVGGGQLGRMLVQAAKNLNIKTIVLDPTINSPAGQIADKQITGDFKNSKSVLKLAKKVDFLTFEIESANWQALKKLENQGFKVNPSSKTLQTIQDKLLQKQFLLANSIPCAQFTDVKTTSDIKRVASYLGYPLILKARFHGYDGRGNAKISKVNNIVQALKKLRNQKLYIEKYIHFKKELAIQIIKSQNGQLKAFPLVETLQKNNICHIVKFPSLVTQKIEKEAKNLALKTVSNLYGAGVFGIEMFLAQDDKVLVNEIAPRVHNSGHWTIEGCNVSQFEEHVRTVCSLPIKNVRPKTKAAVMINILGERSGPAKIKRLDNEQMTNGTFVHIYGKFETRPERKMGHITVIDQTLNKCLRKATIARSLISI